MMPEVSLSARELSERRPAIIRLLAPLLANRNRIEIRQIGPGRHYTLGILNKGQSPSLVEDANLIRVATKVSSIFLNYYEVWTVDSSSGDYLLERAYLHLHLKRSDT